MNVLVAGNLWISSIFLFHPMPLMNSWILDFLLLACCIDGRFLGGKRISFLPGNSMPLLSITFNCSSLCLGFGDIDVPINLKFLSGCSSMIDSTPRTCRKDEIFLWEMIGFVSSVILVLLKIMITYSGPAPSEGPAGRPLVFNLALTLISTPSLLVSRTQLQQAFFQRSFYNDSLADLEAAQ